MKTIADIAELVRAGARPVITFRAGIADIEGYAEAGMRARLVRASEADRDGCIKLTFAFPEFDEHNVAFESANYYDKQGKPTLTAREAGYYKPEDDAYFMATDALENLLVPDGAEAVALLTEFKESGFKGTYVAWLESQLLATRTPA